MVNEYDALGMMGVRDRRRTALTSLLAIARYSPLSRIACPSARLSMVQVGASKRGPHDIARVLAAWTQYH
jgi:hypothetical protein